MIDTKENFLEVEALGEDLAWKVIKLWMETEGRDLNNYQWRVVANAISECSLPIFLKLVSQNSNYLPISNLGCSGMWHFM